MQGEDACTQLEAKFAETERSLNNQIAMLTQSLNQARLQADAAQTYVRAQSSASASEVDTNTSAEIEANTLILKELEAQIGNAIAVGAMHS